MVRNIHIKQGLMLEKCFLGKAVKNYSILAGVEALKTFSGIVGTK